MTSSAAAAPSTALLPPPPGMSLPVPSMPVPPPVVEWHYIDGEDVVQGPFSMEMMTQWYEEGYLEADLKIKLNGWSSFHPLSEVYPAEEAARTFTYVADEPEL
jgi:hypothetical protein